MVDKRNIDDVEMNPVIYTPERGINIDLEKSLTGVLGKYMRLNTYLLISK